MVGTATRPQLLRLSTIGLVGTFIASACSALAASEPLGVARPAREGDEETPPVVRDWDELFGEPTGEPLDLVPETEPAIPPPEPVAPAPKVTTIKLRPRPTPGPFSINLYEKGDFMHQQTKDWCVAGSTQTMMNIIDPGRPNRSAAFQRRLYVEGRRLSRNQAKLTSIGVDLSGWAALLNTKGYGPYVVDGTRTRAAAIRRAARALRMTGRPVGLVTWRGAHSWVMSGFTATADPAYTADFVVKKVFIQDTWYPYVSTIWGASRPPNAAVPVAALAEDYLPYRRPSHRWPKRDGKFMLILPTLPPDTIAR